MKSNSRTRPNLGKGGGRDLGGGPFLFLIFSAYFICARTLAGGEPPRAKGERSGHVTVLSTAHDMSLRGGTSRSRRGNPFPFFICALALADDGSCRSDAFFACAAGGQEDPRAGPSCQSPGPRGRGKDSSPRDSTPSAACVPWRFGSVTQWGLVPRRMEQVPSRLSYVDLQGAVPG